MGLISKPMATNKGTSTAAPIKYMRVRLSFVAVGIGGVGIIRDINKDRINIAVEIPTFSVAGLRVVLARIKNNMLAHTQKIKLKIITSVTGSGLTSGGGNSSGAINSIPTRSLRMK